MGEPAARGRKPKPLVGRSRRLMALERGVARLRLYPDRHLGAQVLYGLAALVGLATAVTTLWVDADAWWGILVAPIFLGLGFLYGPPDRVTRLDFRKRLLVLGNRQAAARAIPFAKLAGIVADARIEVVKSQDASFEVRRFVLGFLVADEADSIHATLEGLRRDRRAVICEGEESPVQKLSGRLARELQARVLTVVDHPDETAVWQASEWLAKRLDLPLVDACSAPTVLRIPEELDLSLGERLALGLQAIDELDEPTTAYAPVPAPPGASVEWRDGKCTLTWKRNRLVEVLLLVGLALFFPVLGLLLLEERDATFWVFAAVGFCLLPLAWLASHWHGVNQLTVDRKRVNVTRGPLGKRLPVLTTDRIEAIRVGGTSQSPLLSLVSERRVLRIPMSQPVARWAKRNIERHLRAVYDKPPKLAR